VPMSENTIGDEWKRAHEDNLAGRFDECIGRTRLLLRRDPNNARAHAYLADVLSKVDDWAAAIVEYRAALRINPAHTRWRTSLADALSEKGQSEQAIMECLEALRREPESCDVHNTLGWVFSRLDMFDAALSEQYEALRLAATDFEHRSVRYGICSTLFKKASFSSRRHKWHRLRHNWREFRDLAGYGPAGISETRGEWLEARAGLEEYESRYPGDPDVLTMLGQAQWELGEKDAALETLWKAFDIDPPDHWRFRYLSRHLLSLGKWRSFALVFQRAVDNTSLDPRDRIRTRARRWREESGRD